MVISASDLKEMALSLGADTVGLARAKPVENPERFDAWLDKGYAGDMDYLGLHLKERLNPEVLLPGAKSIIVIGVNYFPAKVETPPKNPKYRVAQYARGEDYHRVLRRILKKLRSKIKRKYSNEIEGRICVDTAPFMDIHWAQRAGLGWQGKHTGLVSRKFGNHLLIGSLVITAVVDSYDSPHPDHCGTCTRCLEACPTDAFPSPYVMDATRCISYWTIESKQETIPETIGRALNGFVFGCDICTSACPFNRFSKPGRNPALRRSDKIELIESGGVVKMSEDEFKMAFSDSPILRPGLNGIKRNISAIDRYRRKQA